MSAQLNHAHRPNGTATFSVCIGIVRVSGLRHVTIEVVSSNSWSLTLQNCVVHRLTFWFTGQADHRDWLKLIRSCWEAEKSLTITLCCVNLKREM